MPKNPFGASEYRADIDGLRAVAVISVIINHFSEKLLPGGYLGVDIFFVISGYVITSSLSSLDKDSLRAFLAQFYARRIRRILPALITYVAIVALLISAISPFTDLFVKTGVSSFLGLSNIYLYKQSTGYWESFSKLNPFLHTWSLGVEEQFYFIYPALLWACGYQNFNKKGRTIAALAVLCVISYLVFLISSLSFPNFAQYMLPARFWEICLGCLGYLLIKDIQSKACGINSEKNYIIAMIILCSLLSVPRDYDVISKTSVGLLSTYIVSATHCQNIRQRILCNKITLAVGLRSYSLYLWHWGVLAIARLTVGVSVETSPALIAATLIAAFLSYEYIEKPFRLKRRKMASETILGGLLVCGIFSISILNFSKLKLYQGSPVFDPVAKSEVRNDKNCNIFQVKAADFSRCIVVNSGATRTLYLIGDSHSFQFAQAMKELSKVYRFNYYNIWGTGCPFPASLGKYPSRQCRSKQDGVGSYIVDHARPNDIVIIANTLSLSVSQRFRSENQIARSNRNRAFAAKLGNYINKFKDKGLLIVLYVNPPYFTKNDYPGWACQRIWFRSQDVIAKCPTAQLSHHRREIRADLPELRSWEKDNSVIIWEPALNQKNCINDYCDSSVYMDSNHYSNAYSYEALALFLKENRNSLGL